VRVTSFGAVEFFSGEVEGDKEKDEGEERVGSDKTLVNDLMM
jgi:hypothetical protein